MILSLVGVQRIGENLGKTGTVSFLDGVRAGGSGVRGLGDAMTGTWKVQEEVRGTVGRHHNAS